MYYYNYNLFIDVLINYLAKRNLHQPQSLFLLCFKIENTYSVKFKMLIFNQVFKSNIFV